MQSKSVLPILWLVLPFSLADPNPHWTQQKTAESQGLIRRHDMEGLLQSLSFSSDGKTYAVGLTRRRAIDLYETADGKVVRSFPPRELGGHAIAFSPGGELLAYAITGTDEKEEDFNGVRVWHIGKSKTLFNLKQRPVTCLAISLDSKILAAGNGLDADIKLWDLSNGQLLATLKGHANVNCLAFSPDGKFLVSGGHDRRVIMWDVAKQTLAWTLHERKEGCFETVAFSKDGMKLFVGDAAGKLEVWDLKERKVIKIYPLKDQARPLTSVAFSASRGLAATGSSDSTIKLWRLSDGKEIQILKHSPFHEVTHMAFSPDGRYLLSGGQSTNLLAQTQVEIFLWDLAELSKPN